MAGWRPLDAAPLDRTTPPAGDAPAAAVVAAGARAVDLRPQTIDHRTSIYREAVAIVAVEYAGDLRVEEIARRVATSRRQLQRSFAEIGHTSFSRHLADVRMKRAAELLATAPLSVHEVARSVGYNAAAHFAKAFRRHHGVSPSAFRRQSRDFRLESAALPTPKNLLEPAGTGERC